MVEGTYLVWIKADSVEQAERILRGRLERDGSAELDEIPPIEWRTVGYRRQMGG